MIFFLLGTLTLLVAIGLILVVIIQNSKGGGLSSTFGASGAANQLLGTRRSSEFIEKLTWYLAGGLALLAFFANVAGSAADASRLAAPTLKNFLLFMNS